VHAVQAFQAFGLEFTLLSCHFARVFFRNIGRLGRTIKSRVHPAKNLVNQYLRMLPLTNSDEADEDEATAVKDEPIDDDGPVVDDEFKQHPLVYLGAITSSCRSDQIVWPDMTRWTSRLKYKTVKHHARDRLLLPALGAEWLRRLGRGGAEGFRWITTERSIRVGMWVFDCSATEKRSGRRGVSSWFCIRIRDVAHLHDQNQPQDIQVEVLSRGSEALLYGRFHHFVQLQLPTAKAGDRMHALGRCTLYNVVRRDEITELEEIDVSQPLQYFDGTKLREVQYIPLTCVHTQVAIAPGFRFAEDGSGRAHIAPDLWVAMPLQK